METEKEGRLPFLDVMVTTMNTDRYLNNGSNHHPNQKRGVMKTLSERAKRSLNIWKGFSDGTDTVDNNYSTEPLAQETSNYVDNKRGMLKRKLVGLAYHTYTRSQELEGF